MIDKIQISNFALIKNLEINFKSGFNVLLGETGAGKSIIINAINFLLGGKADKSQIRSGEEQTKVVGSFSVSRNLEKLSKFGIFDETVVISRVFNIAGKNEIKINGEIASLSVLKEVGELFLDSYNQNDQVELKKTKNHLFILDSFKPELTAELKSVLAQEIAEINEIDANIQKFGGDEKTRARKIDMLSFQINEIEEAKIYDGEFEEILDSLNRISNSEKVINCLNSLNEVLSSDNSLISSLNVAKHSLNSVVFEDKKLSELAERLESTCIELEDISESLNEIYDEYNFDENKVNQLILRREKLDGLKHKYGTTYEEINNFLNNAKNELDELTNSEEILKELQTKREGIKQKIYSRCEEISHIRQKLALELEGLMQTGLKDVGIKNSKFKICFASKPEYVEFETFNPLGFDDVEFMFSANLGEELKPLSKTISGGEMSRFMLVLKNIIAKNEGTETIIFDEIDTGISGEIADKVACKIEELSETYQIICITHLPQVAAKGDNFIKVFKTVDNSRTQTQVEILAEKDVLNQIAIMASGSGSESAIEYAKSLRESKNW